MSGSIIDLTFKDYEKNKKIPTYKKNITNNYKVCKKYIIEDTIKNNIIRNVNYNIKVNYNYNNIVKKVVP